MMTIRWEMARRARDDRGIALITVLILMVLMSGLTAALVVSSTTETVIARNHQLASEARAAAEAGLMHASQLAITRIQAWQADGFASPSLAMSALLRGPDNLSGTVATDADNGSLEALGIPRRPARLQLAALPGVFYDARVFDEDDPSRGVTLSAADRARITEDNQATIDANMKVLVQAVGYSNGDAIARVEATIGAVQMPAIVTNGSLTMSGNPTVTGAGGGVHANADLSLNGTVSIAQNATASGNYSTSGSPSVGGLGAGGQSNQTVPNINAADYLGLADFILKADGTLTNPAGTVLCDASGNADACKAGYGWVFGGTDWNLSSNTWTQGTYYAETDIRITGNAGSPGNPALISIFAEGSIDISGNPDMQPDTPDLFLVTNGDLDISGGLDVHGGETQILVREQLSLSGTGSYSGQILVQDVPSVSNLVTANSIVGTKVITYSGISSNPAFQISAWRWLP